MQLLNNSRTYVCCNYIHIATTIKTLRAFTNVQYQKKKDMRGTQEAIRLTLHGTYMYVQTEEGCLLTL